MQDKANAFDAQYRAELEEKEHPKYVPTCPTCGSPDIEKISGTSKVVDAVVWGIYPKRQGRRLNAGTAVTNGDVLCLYYCNPY
ncbi:MAG: hypothetical protein ACLRWM_00465 [Streptococcus sp.]